MTNLPKLPKSFSMRQFCEAAICSVRHAHDMVKDGRLKTYTVGTSLPRHYISQADWADFFLRLEGDRIRLKKPGLRFPVTLAGEAPPPLGRNPFMAALKAAEAAIRRQEDADAQVEIALSVFQHLQTTNPDKTPAENEAVVMDVLDRAHAMRKAKAKEAA